MSYKYKLSKFFTSLNSFPVTDFGIDKMYNAAMKFCGVRITIILTLLFVDAFALADQGKSTECNALLSRSLEGAGADLKANSSGLSSNAVLYLRLIQHYLSKATNKAESLQTLSILATAPQAIDPFSISATGPDQMLRMQISQSIQSKDLLKKIIPEWAAIQSKIREVIAEIQQTETQRVTSQRETQNVFVLKETDSFKNPHFGTDPAWTRIGDTIYLAVGSDDEHLYLFKFVPTSGKLQLLERIKIVTTRPPTPSWQVIGDSVYLVVTTYNQLSLYRLDWLGEKLQFLDNYENIGYIAQSPSWQVLGTSVFIALGSNNGHVYVFEVDRKDEKIHLKSKFPTKHSITTSITWQVVGKKAYLAVTSGKKLHLFKFYEYSFSVNLIFKKFKFSEWLLKLTDVYEFENEMEAPASWQIIGESVFLATGSSKDTETTPYNPKNTNVHLFEVDRLNDKLNLKDKYDTKNRVVVAPKWQTVGNKAYLAVGSLDAHLYLFEVNQYDKKLKLLDTHFLGAAVYLEAAWTTVEDRVYLAQALRFGESIELYEVDFRNDKLNHLSSIEIEGKIETNPQWQVVDDTSYLALGSKGRLVNVIQVFQSVNRQGGAQ